MSPADLDLANQEKLKRELQAEEKSSKLENLTAALLSRLLDVPIAVSRSGFQHGGDAGPAGQQGRRFRLECKKYSDSTRLSDRELLGEIDHALARDPALEGWFLIATREVPEQLVQDLVSKGEHVGVPIIIIDWKDHDAAPLAALCAFAPDLVERIFSPEAGALSRALQPTAANTIASLRRQLQSWCLGFESLRVRSHAKLDDIWNEPRVSAAELGQSAAGGAQQHRVKRQSVHEKLAEWWQGEAKNDAPAIVVGWDGVGKTWSTLDWLVDTKADQPVVLVVPSSATATMSGVSETALKRFIGERLYEIVGVRGVDYWSHRLEHLLKRPREEGPVFTILFDGMNQEPSAPWLQLLKVLQSPAFEGRGRVITSCRTHYFEDKLSKLRGLIVPAVPVNVGVYNANVGGELDQMLAFEGLTRADLHPDLIELARTPRLFNLVIRFRERLVEAGQVTVHRLLWEYGRDSFGERAGRSFSESEWQDWLREIARQYRDGVKEFSLRALGETAKRPDLSEGEVYARLSDIVDGRFARPGPSGSMQLTPTVVAHALGAALLAHLDKKAPTTFAAAEAEVTQWLDPISGFDQRAEILRAGVSIMVERDPATSPLVSGALVTAWLQTQNITDNHRRELEGLAVHIPDALLDAVEQSSSHALASARMWAVNALRAIPRTEESAFDAIVQRACRWLSIVSRDVDTRPDADPKHEARRAERYKNKIGIDASVQITVLAVPLQLVDRSDGALATIVPSLLEGFPLARATPCFEVAAIALAVRGYLESWRGLKWLCQLNEVDPEPVAKALRDLSEAVRGRLPEPGIHHELAARVGALLLWLTGDETDEDKAVSINPELDRAFNYEKDYLAKPSRSFFALERRHSSLALNDKDVGIVARIQRTNEFWLDPAFEPPAGFVAELREMAAAFPVEKLHAEGSYTREQHIFEELEPVLARCAQDILADLARRELRSFAGRAPEARYWSAIHATDGFVLVGNAEAAAASALRRSSRDTKEGQEGFAAGQLLMLEIRNLDIQPQFDRMIEAELKFISVNFVEVLRVPTPQDVDALIGRWRNGTDQQQYDLIVLLSVHPIAFSDDAWAWLLQFAMRPDYKLRGLIFRMLAASDERRLGRALATQNWSWDPTGELWINHYGSGALINAESALPFEQLAPRLAPWRLLEAARRRGSDPAEVRLAADILSDILAAPRIDAPDPGSNLSVERSEGTPEPFILSVEPRPKAEDARDPIAAFRAVLDADERIKAYERATEIAVARIDAARNAGATLYLTDVAVADMELVLQHMPEIIDRWLDGCQARTADFFRRVRLAEPAFLALCEALLMHDPARGVDLWRALRFGLVIRYIGAAGIEEILHMVFRVPASSHVEALKDELLNLTSCHSDNALYELALAACYNRNECWLAAVIDRDRSSTLAWQRKRAAILAGFTCNNALPVPEAWPDGEIKTTHARLAVLAAQRRFYEGCAKHWWRAYLTAPNSEAAYAAWVLFMRSADRRAGVWMHDEAKSCNGQGWLFDIKRAHVQLNRSKLRNAMNKRLEKLDRTFLGQDIAEGMGPWARSDNSSVQ